MEIKGEDYTVLYDPLNATITYQGTLRLQGLSSYTPLIQMLNELVEQTPKTITLDIQQLLFVNSPGMDMFLKFVIKARKLEGSNLAFIISSEIPWQSKFSDNLLRLMPDIKLIV